MMRRLIEDLVPFLDHDIHDPAALQLGTQLKRKHRSASPAKVGSCGASMFPSVGAVSIPTNHERHELRCLNYA